MYGILKSNVNTGLLSELRAKFAAPLTLTSNIHRSLSDTLSLRMVGSEGVAQRFEIQATLFLDGPNFAVEQLSRSIDDTIYVRPPSLLKKVGNSSGYSNNNNVWESYPKSEPRYLNNSDFAQSKGTMETEGAKVVGDSTVTIVLGNDAFLFSGDFLNFGNHSKTYMIKTVSNPDTVNKTVDVEIYPPLVSAVSDAVSVKSGIECTMECRFSLDNTFGITYLDGVLPDSGEINLVEKL